MREKCKHLEGVHQKEESRMRALPKTRPNPRSTHCSPGSHAAPSNAQTSSRCPHSTRAQLTALIQCPLCQLPSHLPSPGTICIEPVRLHTGRHKDSQRPRTTATITRSQTQRRRTHLRPQWPTCALHPSTLAAQADPSTPQNQT